MSEKIIKVYVVGGAFAYTNFLTFPFTIVKNIEDSDLVIFTGGEDVDPLMYGEQTGKFTQCNPSRDYEELSYLEKVEKQLCVGICRGAQFLTVAAGGSLVQHVTNHGISGTHEIIISGENRKIQTTSTHHQMMLPYVMEKSSYDIIGYTQARSNTYLDGNNRNMNNLDYIMHYEGKEPEIVLYNNCNFLCIQGHPEYMDKDSDMVSFCNQLITELLEDPIEITREDDKRLKARISRQMSALLAKLTNQNKKMPNANNLDDALQRLANMKVNMGWQDIMNLNQIQNIQQEEKEDDLFFLDEDDLDQHWKQLNKN